MAFFDAANFYGIGTLGGVIKKCNGSSADTFAPVSFGRPSKFTLEVTSEDTMKYLQGFDGVSVPAIAIPTKREAKVMLEFDSLSWNVIQLMANAQATNVAGNLEYVTESAVFTTTSLTYTTTLKVPTTGTFVPSASTMYMSNADGKQLTFAAAPVAGVSFGAVATAGVLVVTMAAADIYGSGRWDILYIAQRTGSQTVAAVGGQSGKFGQISFRGVILGREGGGCNVDMQIYLPNCGRTSKLSMGSGGTSTIDLMATESGGNPSVYMVPVRGGYAALSGTTI